MEDKTIQKRQIAYKVRIKDLVMGNYIKNEGWQPNYIITPNNLKVSRINLIGVVISVDDNPNYKGFTIDDSTERVSVRVFEETSYISNIGVGNVILLIGRPRLYGSDVYIIPEIVKRLEDSKWLMVRKLELKDQVKEDIKKESTKEEGSQEKVENNSRDVAQKVLDAIRLLDKGEGANFDDVLGLVDSKETDKIIDSLIKQGEIFEPRAGKLIIMNA